jgi:hypothetical protein
MHDTSTIVILQHLKRRLDTWDGDDDVFSNVTEQTVHDLHTALHLCLAEYEQVILERIEKGNE